VLVTRAVCSIFFRAARVTTAVMPWGAGRRCYQHRRPANHNQL